MKLTRRTSQSQESTGISSKKDIKSHWSLLEPNIIRVMKVADLREQLELRGLDSKGVKNVLMQRLIDAIEKEKAAEPQEKKSLNQSEEQQTKKRKADETFDQQQQSATEKPAGQQQNKQSKKEAISPSSTDEGEIMPMPTMTLPEPAKMEQDEVLPFLKYVNEQMRQQKLDNLQEWFICVQSILKIHHEYLATVPDFTNQIDQIVEWMEKRIRNMDKLLQLQAKLQFFVEHGAEHTRSMPQRPIMIYEADKEVLRKKKTQEKADDDIVEDSDVEQGNTMNIDID